MNDDPIVDEVRQAGEAYFARFNFDIAAICNDLKRGTEEAAKSGEKIIAFPPRSPEPRPVVSKKAG